MPEIDLALEKLDSLGAQSINGSEVAYVDALAVPAACIWNTDAAAVKFYGLDQTGSEISSFASPSSYPYGVGVDNSGCIWSCDTAAGKIYKQDQTGSIISSFASPSAQPTGIGA